MISLSFLSSVGLNYLANSIKALSLISEFHIRRLNAFKERELTRVEI